MQRHARYELLPLACWLWLADGPVKFAREHDGS